MGAVIDGLVEGFGMFWQTLWALVLGFGLSGAVQAFVSRARMQATLGDHRPATLARASFFGVISSSCSYAASALAKTLFLRGADFTAAMVFMIASTNLVVELGVVMWLLLGWQFALAEFVGGAIMIALLGVVLPLVVPDWMAGAARDRLAGTTTSPGATAAPADWRARSGWSDAAAYTVSDLTMLRKELLIGYLVAGYLAVLVPNPFWQALFVTGHGWWSTLENVVLGPFLAIIAFVCSVGNVPLAAVLWQGGSSFGGVVSFVFADLITLPLLAIYRKYYGGPLTLRLLAAFWAAMSLAGLAVQALFALLRLPAPARDGMIDAMRPSWNYTTVLDLIALVAFAVLYRLYRTRDVAAGRYAKDPVCGMQVEIAHAPAHHSGPDGKVYFCSDHCAHRYAASHGG